MHVKDYVEKLWYKIIYGIGVFIYIIILNNFNKELLGHRFESPFRLLAYEDYAPIKYFVVALILCLFGIILICKEIQQLKSEDKSFEEITLSIFTLIIVGILLLVIIKCISIPILKAILCSISVIVGVVYVAAN